MVEAYRKEDTITPWNMPHEIYWDIKEGASVRRAQWVVDNHDVALEDLRLEMALQPEEIAQLKLPTNDIE